jgi:hypothetical protein
MASIKDFYNDIKSKKASVKNNELSKLYQRPILETGDNMPHFQILEPNYLQNCDTLYMPEDEYKGKKYKYLLVVTDVYNKKMDAEPYNNLKQDSHEVLDALKTIYKRGIVKYPKILVFDNGNENGDVYLKKYLHEHKINVRMMQPGRYRQISSVKTSKRKLASILFRFMTNEELLTGEQSKHWVQEVPQLVEAINENLPPPNTEIPEKLVSTKFCGKMLPIGARVRVLLDRPRDTVKGNLLSGNFRSTDIRWDPNVRRIENILLKPGQIPLYIVSDDGDKLVARTKNQLQLVKRNERAPDVKYIRGDPEYAIINNIKDYRKNERKDEYLVGFKGYDNTHDRWVQVKELNRTADLRAMKDEFNEHRLQGQAPQPIAPVHRQPIAPQPAPPQPAPQPAHRYMLRSRNN